MNGLRASLAAFLLLTALGPACTPATIDCARAEVLCVGLVTRLGKINDQAFNQAAWEGILRAQEQFGGEAQYIETVDRKDYTKNIAAFGDLSYDVIVTVGSDLSEATLAAADRYPATDFIGVDQFQEEPVEGVSGLIFPEDQAGFLAGALAAMLSRSHKIGAVCPTDDLLRVWRFGEGFKAGAVYIDEQMTLATDVYVLYHPDNEQAFSDPEWGAETAKSMMDQGADIIASCGSLTGEGGLIAAAQAGLYVIGVDSDQYLTLPEAAPRMLSSAVKLVTPGVFELIKLSREAAFPSGNHSGTVGYAPFHDLENAIPSDVKSQMAAIHTGLLNGTIQTGIPSIRR